MLGIVYEKQEERHQKKKITISLREKKYKTTRNKMSMYVRKYILLAIDDKQNRETYIEKLLQ